LVVDDCLVTQTLLKGILSPRYRVLVAGSALEALSVISREQVDLFLVDLTMPDVDGLELCRTIRRLPLCQAAPIVILTSRDRPFDRVQGSIAGATEYLTKPIDAETLQTTLHKHLPNPQPDIPATPDS
jgi:twitching motility two-component system response regulator PilG